MDCIATTAPTTIPSSHTRSSAVAFAWPELCESTDGAVSISDQSFVARSEHRGQTPNSPYRDPPSGQIGGAAANWTGERDIAAAGVVGVEAHFHAALAVDGMCVALGLLNARTRYRFTGVYRLDPPLLRNECLFDRENPSLS